MDGRERRMGREDRRRAGTPAPASVDGRASRHLPGLRGLRRMLPAGAVPRAGRQPAVQGVRAMTAWIFDDGGRADSGRRGKTGDCVTRAIAIVAGLPYGQVYDELFTRSRAYWLDPGHKYAARIADMTPARRTPLLTPNNGMTPKVYKPFLAELGMVWTPTMFVGKGTSVHVRADELPAGRLILRCSKHLTTMIDGIIHDTYDPSRDGTRAVYGYWTAPQ